MTILYKTVLLAAISVFAVQYIAPTVAQTVDVLSNDREIRRIIRERCDA